MNLIRARAKRKPLTPLLRPVSGTVIVSGATAGLGFYTALSLAKAGYRLVIASRSQEKMAAASAEIVRQVPDAQVDNVLLDLTDFSSIDQASIKLKAYRDVSAIVLNAGVVGSRSYRETENGLELQIGTNHIGHFRLLAQLLKDTSSAQPMRIVHLGSISYRWVRLGKNRLIPTTYWNPKNYALSKLAVMTFGYELARRLEKVSQPIESVLVHPGFAWDHFDTESYSFMKRNPLPRWLTLVLTPFAWSKAEGSQAAVLAVRTNDNLNGAYIGPDGFFYGSRGTMIHNRLKRKVRSRSLASRLWRQSEELAEIPFPLGNDG